MPKIASKTHIPDGEEIFSVRNLLAEHRMTLSQWFNITGCARVCTYQEFAAAMRQEVSRPEVCQQVAFSALQFKDWLASPKRLSHRQSARTSLSAARNRRRILEVELAAAREELDAALREAERLWSSKHALLLSKVRDLDDEVRFHEDDLAAVDMEARRAPSLATAPRRGRPPGG